MNFLKSSQKCSVTIEEFFTPEEYAAIPPYEKQHLLSLRQNFEVLKKAGLPVKPPEFMLKKNEKDRRYSHNTIPFTDSEGSDSEWTPAADKAAISGSKRKKITSWNAPKIYKVVSTKRKAEMPMEKTAAKKKTPKNEKEEESEEEVHIYPLRKKRTANFMSLAIPEDDDFLFCEDCNFEYIYECPLHALTPVQDPNVLPQCEKGLDSNYCWKTLPQGLAIKKSKIRGAGLGVFATTFFPNRTRFGPYVGKKEKNEDVAHESGYSWQIFKDGKPSHFVNASDPSCSNWMRFVNCARNEDEQCVTAYQHAGEIYYRTHKDVVPGTELLVYYGDSYAKELGIDIQAVGKGGQTTSSKESDLPRIDNLIIPTRIDHVLEPSQEDQSRSDEDIFKCKFCKIAFSHQMYLWNHLRKKHNEQYHQMKHIVVFKEKDEIFFLQKMKKETSNANQIVKKKIQAGERPFKCEVCGKGFTVSCNLTVHKRTHSGEKPFKCDVCGKGFTESGHLTRHIRTHSGEKPFKCEVCGKGFIQSGDLTAHKRTHSGEKPFKCEVCGKGFTVSGHLTRHIRTHSGEKPFKCEVCGKGFIQSNNLTAHKRTHSGEKPFKCEVCGKGFTKSGNLTAHKRTHSGEKPFKCEVCGKGFIQSNNLTAHKRTHSGEKPFKCEVCGKGFTVSNNLTAHKRTHSG